jgi:Fuc2NAc and GlcNAc transferase
MTTWIIGGVLALALSFLFTRIAILVLQKRLIDTPNERSSHSIPTPRGGGIAIGLSVLASSVVMALASDVQFPWIWLLAPLSMAALGFLDDAFQLGIRIRFSVQLLASALITTYALLPFNLDTVFFVASLVVLTVGLTWLTNLYNFMDGINGIAAIETITVASAMAIVFWTIGNTTFIPVLILLAASALGFLYWNFPRASIFMGDVGSLYLGFALGALAIATSLDNILIASAWLIMLSVFITDATCTLLRRLLSGQRFWQAHRLHAYQKMAVRFGTHTTPSLAVAFYNLGWCLPIAWSVMHTNLPYWAGLCVVYIPLVLVAAFFKAGKQE